MVLGAIMAVPAHDERDFEFAQKFDLPIKKVISSDENIEEPYISIETGKMINSGFLNGLEVKDAIKTMIEYVEKNEIGIKKVNYKLRDWVFSRQRYWGEPIPVVDCDQCGWVGLRRRRIAIVIARSKRFSAG